MALNTDKSLGQHWLNDEVILADIIKFSGVKAQDIALEIGPGQGSLTRKLVGRAKQVIAVEFDPTLAKKLTGQFPGRDVKIIAADILNFDLNTLPTGYKVVANLPYYITSKIIRKLLESSNPPQNATLLVQKEVAQRLAAAPGEMSILSVAAQFYAEVKLGQIVPPEMFTPPPKVDSQLVKLTYGGPRYSDVLPDKFFQLVKAGFSNRRKKLRSSLSGGLRISKLEADKLLRSAGLKPDQRAQELSLHDWHALTKAYFASLKS